MFSVQICPSLLKKSKGPDNAYTRLWIPTWSWKITNFFLLFLFIDLKGEKFYHSNNHYNVDIKHWKYVANKQKTGKMTLPTKPLRPESTKLAILTTVPLIVVIIYQNEPITKCNE